MSALARYFKRMGLPVAGYDRTPSPLTDALQKEGIEVYFDDSPERIKPQYRKVEDTLVIYTPAVGEEQAQLLWFRGHGFSVMKRARVLGLISSGSKGVCISGTHGKTTISTLTAHLFKESHLGCTAFLGGISKNFGSNFLWDEKSDYVVMEADEYDRSFLWLQPQTALISSVDADHLDIYGDRESFIQAFSDFAAKVREGGNLVVKEGLDVDLSAVRGVKMYRYALNSMKADFYAKNIRIEKGYYNFELQTPDGLIEGLKMGIPGLLNVENAVGALALAYLNGVKADELRDSLPLFKGISRRFDIHVKSGSFIYIDDYAHHPEEIRATIESVRLMYPGYYLTGVFQPHLYTRTRDFAEEFASSLSALDEVILLDIYPARELPIEGVSSKSIGDKISGTPVKYYHYKELTEAVEIKDVPQIVITMGAGDIDRLVPALSERFRRLMES